MGYHGPACDEVAYTDYSTCGYKCGFDRGVCAVAAIEGVNRYWACECGDDYFGANCQRFACKNHCSWNGDWLARLHSPLPIFLTTN